MLQFSKALRLRLASAFGEIKLNFPQTRKLGNWIICHSHFAKFCESITKTWQDFDWLWVISSCQGTDTQISAVKKKQQPWSQPAKPHISVFHVTERQVFRVDTAVSGSFNVPSGFSSGSAKFLPWYQRSGTRPGEDAEPWASSAPAWWWSGPQWRPGPACPELRSMGLGWRHHIKHQPALTGTGTGLTNHDKSWTNSEKNRVTFDELCQRLPNTESSRVGFRNQITQLSETQRKS